MVAYGPRVYGATPGSSSDVVEADDATSDAV